MIILTIVFLKLIVRDRSTVRIFDDSFYYFGTVRFPHFFWRKYFMNHEYEVAHTVEK